MRYFEFVLKINLEQISEKARIKLREYAYQNPVATMNNYMYQFYDYLPEARRRDYFSGWMKIAEAENVTVFNYYKNELVSFYQCIFGRLATLGILC